MRWMGFHTEQWWPLLTTDESERAPPSAASFGAAGVVAVRQYGSG